MRNTLLSLALKRKSLAISSVLLLLIFNSCTIKLAPEYNQKIVDSITEVSSDLFHLFAENSEGSEKELYEYIREPKYNNILAKLETLKLQIASRPLPSNDKLQKIYAKINQRLGTANQSLLNIDLSRAPSEESLDNIIKNIEQMKKSDSKNGLSELEVKLFKNNVTIYLDQMATYENFLKQD